MQVISSPGCSSSPQRTSLSLSSSLSIYIYMFLCMLMTFNLMKIVKANYLENMEEEKHRGIPTLSIFGINDELQVVDILWLAIHSFRQHPCYHNKFVRTLHGDTLPPYFRALCHQEKVQGKLLSYQILQSTLCVCVVKYHFLFI